MNLTGDVHADGAEAASRRRASPTQDEFARQVQAHTRGRWLCWYGHFTGRYWAIGTAPGLSRLIESTTPKELLIAIREVEAYGSAPCPAAR